MFKRGITLAGCFMLVCATLGAVTLSTEVEESPDIIVTEEWEDKIEHEVDVGKKGIDSLINEWDNEIGEFLREKEVLEKQRIDEEKRQLERERIAIEKRILEEKKIEEEKEKEALVEEEAVEVSNFSDVLYTVICSEMSHYCACSICNDIWAGKLKDRSLVWNGMDDPLVIAANWLPLGSKVRIDGKVYTNRDNGGHSRLKVYGNIDMFSPLGHDAVMSLGIRREVEIEVLYVPENDIYV